MIILWYGYLGSVIMMSVLGLHRLNTRVDWHDQSLIEMRGHPVFTDWAKAILAVIFGLTWPLVFVISLIKAVLSRSK